MDWSDLGKAIKKFAPLLGTVIGGPVGGAVGKTVSGITSLIMSAFGVESEDPGIRKNLTQD